MAQTFRKSLKCTCSGLLIHHRVVILRFSILGLPNPAGKHLTPAEDLALCSPGLEMLLQEPKARNLFFLRHLNFFSSVPLSKLQEHTNTSKTRLILAEHQEKRWSRSEFGSYYVQPVLPGFPDSTCFSSGKN